MQIQNPVTSPGTGSFTTHSIEIFVICLGMLLLGWFLYYAIYGKKQEALIKSLEGQLKSSKTQITNLEGDLESCNAAIVRVKGENAAMGAQLSRIAKEGQGLGLEEHELELPNISAQEEMIADVMPQTIDDLLIAGLAADIAGAGMIAFDAHGAERAFGKSVQEDDLQIIDGIGPMTASLLQNHSIHTWRQLGSTSVPQIQSILQQGGEKFSMLNPSSWPKQARMAADGEWSKLREYLDFLQGGTAGAPDLSAKGVVVDEQGVSEDLTQITGVGRKVQALLYSHGIDQWAKLATTEVNQLEEILHTAGERFRRHDPSSWPKQAELAAAGRWDDLREYQESLESDSDT